MKKLILLLLFIPLVFSCSKEPNIFTLITSANPSEGGTVTGGMQYSEGEVATISATPTAEYEFKNWSGSASGNSKTTTVIMNSDKSVVANFVKKKYALTSSVEGEGTVTERVIKAGVATDYNSGTILELTAVPSNEWLFVEWKGDITGTENPIQITIDKAKSVTAVFVKKKYALSLEIEGEGTVTEKVIKAGVATDYNSGTILELTAVPSDEWLFVEWKGDITGTENPIRITIDKAKSVTAVFVKEIKPYVDENGVTIKIDESATCGQEFELTVNGVTDTYIVVCSREDIWRRIDNNEIITYFITSKVTNMNNLFDGYTINGNITRWDVSNVTGMNNTFKNQGNFNQDISRWNMSNVLQAGWMFEGAGSFNQDIGNWDVSSLNYANWMFKDARSFNQDISTWDVSNVERMLGMFRGAESFNQNIGNWNISKVSSIAGMFDGATSFNQDIGNWDLTKVTDLTWTFRNATSFNQDISNWDVSNVTNMQMTFQNAIAFNQNISKWNTSNVYDFISMFDGATNFNQDIGEWDVSSVTTFARMFKDAISFNKYIGDWDVSSIDSGHSSNLFEMFYGASSFNQDLSRWCVSNLEKEPQYFSFLSALTEYNKPKWGKCPIVTSQVTVTLKSSTSSSSTVNGVITNEYIIVTQINNNWKSAIEVLRSKITLPNGESKTSDNVKGMLESGRTRGVSWSFNDFKTATITWTYKHDDEEYDVSYIWELN